jgi:hypothetical protein
VRIVSTAPATLPSRWSIRKQQKVSRVMEIMGWICLFDVKSMGQRADASTNGP